MLNVSQSKYRGLTKGCEEEERKKEINLHKHLGTTITLGWSAVHGHGLPVTGELQSEFLLHELLDHLLENTEIKGFLSDRQSPNSFQWFTISRINNYYVNYPQHLANGRRTLTEQQALALSTLDRFFTLELNTFIFSTRQHRAVSVASPTFSKIFLDWRKKKVMERIGSTVEGCEVSV